MSKTIIIFDVADPAIIRLRAHLDSDDQLNDPAFKPQNSSMARLSLDRSIGETLKVIPIPPSGDQKKTTYDNQWADLTKQAASLFANGASDMIAGASASGTINGTMCTVEVGSG